MKSSCHLTGNDNKCLIKPRFAASAISRAGVVSCENWGQPGYVGDNSLKGFHALAFDTRFHFGYFSHNDAQPQPPMNEPPIKPDERLRQPKISIIIATFNAASTLARALQSVRVQTYGHYELIIADGASTDGTVEIIKSHGNLITRWLSEPDSGVYDAWNKGLKLATGEWICFLGADDRFFSPAVLQDLSAHLATAYPPYRVVYGQVVGMRDDGEVVFTAGEPWSKAKLTFRSYDNLPHPGLMHHRSLFDIHGLFDERFRFAADYELLLRELKANDALFVPVTTVAMGQGGLTTTPENFKLMLAETEQALARHGFRPPPLRWAYWKTRAHMYLWLHRLVGDRRARMLADIYRLATLKRRRFAVRKTRRR